MAKISSKAPQNQSTLFRPLYYLQPEQKATSKLHKFQQRVLAIRRARHIAVAENAACSLTCSLYMGVCVCVLLRVVANKRNTFVGSFPCCHTHTHLDLDRGMAASVLLYLGAAQKVSKSRQRPQKKKDHHLGMRPFQPVNCDFGIGCTSLIVITCWLGAGRVIAAPSSPNSSSSQAPSKYLELENQSRAWPPKPGR